MFVGANEGLLHKFVRPVEAGPPSHGRNGFGDVVFKNPGKDNPENPVIQEEHAVNAINRLVNKYPGN